MDRRRRLLVIFLAVLAVLVVLDNSDLDLDALWQRARTSILPFAPAPVDDRLQALQRAVGTRDDIERAYREVAIRYATRAAELDTLVLEAGDPRRVALEAIDRRLRAIRHLKVKQATAGEARRQGDGVSLVTVALNLEAPTHEAAMRAVIELARPDRGYAWEALDVQADAEAQRIRVSGEVLTVIVESAE